MCRYNCLYFSHDRCSHWQLQKQRGKIDGGTEGHKHVTSGLPAATERLVPAGAGHTPTHASLGRCEARGAESWWETGQSLDLVTESVCQSLDLAPGSLQVSLWTW